MLTSYSDRDTLDLAFRNYYNSFNMYEVVDRAPNRIFYRKLITYFVEAGLIQDLVRVCLAGNRGNPKLRAVAAKFGVYAQSQSGWDTSHLAEVYAALLAFGNKRALGSWFGQVFGFNMNEITSDGTLRDVVNEVVQWADANGQIGTLTTALQH